MKTLLLIDGHSLLHRAFHAMPQLTTSESKPIGAVFGFSKMLLSVFLDYSFDCVIVAWDTGAPTFRHEWFAEYKQHRPETDETLRDQFPVAQKVVKAMGITQYSFEGYEADDIIGTAAYQLAGDNSGEWMVKILSSDNDLLQLVNDRVHVLSTKSGISTLVEYDEGGVFEKYELTPKQVIELKGLMGDSSDNIPGVKGIGIKTATDLLKQYETIDGVYKHIKDITGKKQTLLMEQHEMALLSRKLATIRTDAPISIDWEECAKGSNIDFQSLLDLYRKFGFSSLMKQFNTLKDRYSPKQEALFAVEAEENEEPVFNSDVDSFQKALDTKNTVYVLRFSDNKNVVFMIGEDVYSFPIKQLHDDSIILAALSQSRLVGFDLKSLLKDIDFIPEFDLQLADAITGYGMGAKDLMDSLFKRLGIVIDTSSNEASIILYFPQLHSYFTTALETESELKMLFYDIEMPLIRILDEMEKNGILVDKKELNKLDEELKGELDNLEQDIYADIGHEINLNSPKQLEEVLFDELRLPVIKRTKTQRSTNEQVLNQLKHVHPAIEKILRYRTLSKLISTYTSKLAELVEEKDRINTTFNQLKVVTARLSSEQPNMQNVPREKEYGIRKIFVAPQGSSLVALDYSQIELRILAHLSQDEHLIQSFSKNQDIHAVTAAKIFDCFVDEVDTKQRNVGKTINFAVMYGMGPHALSESLEIEFVQAQKYIDDYFEYYPGVQKWRQESMDFAKQHGYVQTLWGRKIAITEIQSKNRRLQSAGERMATNYPNQGTQADLIKKAMVEIFSYIKDHRMQDTCKLILQVHDELIFEINDDACLAHAETFRSIMQNIVTLDVPLKVDVKIGQNWQELEEVG